MEAIEIYRDSQLVVYQITKEYQARSEKIVANLAEARCLLKMFQNNTIKRVPQSQNVNVDALA